MFNTIGIIGGSGFTHWHELSPSNQASSDTPYGSTSSPPTPLAANHSPYQAWFISRHGEQHQFPPHCVNYRANLYAFKQLNCDALISINTVGGIRSDLLEANTIVMPDQIVDYTYGREHTYFDGKSDHKLEHIDFAHPFDHNWQAYFLAHLSEIHQKGIKQGATYGCTQGPRLETSAEIKRMKQDGCDLVGMTLMPEAALARELKIPLLSLCMVVNPAAGILSHQPMIPMSDILRAIEESVKTIKSLLNHFFSQPK